MTRSRPIYFESADELPRETLPDFLWKVAELQTVQVLAGYHLMIFLREFFYRRTSPRSLRPLLIIHNMTCCLLATVTLVGFTYGLYINGSIYGKVSNNVLRRMFTIFWLTKNVELFDTVLMILRHKQRQVTFLHAYHHTTILLLADLARLYWPWPTIATFLAVNSLIHAVLYLYYALRAIYPENPPRWKKLLTQMQLLQFMIMLVFSVYGYLYHGFCIWSTVFGATMLSLFSKLYFQQSFCKKALQGEHPKTE